MCAACLFTTPVHADDTIDAWASWALAPKVWKGQTVFADDPQPNPRPESGGNWQTLASLELPVRAHLPAGTLEQRALHILTALERAYTTLWSEGWPLPAFDGALGGGPDVDLYSVPRSRCAGVAVCAGSAGPLTPSDFDAALTYAQIASDVPSPELDACVLSALSQAGMHAVDPAEAQSWVLASGELSVWQLMGELGCDSSFSRGQQLAEQGLLNAAVESGYGGALFLGMLSERVEQHPGDLLKSLWETTRQRSRGLVDEGRLRSSPDLWEVLQLLLEAQHIKLEDELIEFGVARYFAGPSARRRQAPYRILAALPSDAAVPLAHDIQSDQLPVKLMAHAPLQDLGNAYVRVGLAEAARGELQVWLNGELGPRWSLTAVRLSDTGQELGRISAPPRNVPSAYLPVALDPETAEVVVVVTQLPAQLPDADLRIDTQHGYALTLQVSTN